MCDCNLLPRRPSVPQCLYLTPFFPHASSDLSCRSRYGASESCRRRARVTFGLRASTSASASTSDRLKWGRLEMCVGLSRTCATHAMVRIRFCSQCWEWETHNTTRKPTHDPQPPVATWLSLEQPLFGFILSSRATAEALARLLERAVSCGEQASEFELVPRRIVLCSNLPHF